LVYYIFENRIINYIYIYLFCYWVNSKESIKILGKGYHSLISPNYDICEKCYNEYDNNKYKPYIELDFI
jgi:hypothetical protein